MRRIQAPGIEINEIDKSAYNDQFDESLIDTTSLVCGFADKGQDYEAQYINSMNQFVDVYGTPTNEAERYFYYGAKEVLDNRGQLICAKLPYDNDVLDKISYTTYGIAGSLTLLSSPFDIIDQDLVNLNLDVLQQPQRQNSFFDVLNMNKLGRTGFDAINSIDKNAFPKYQADLIDYAFNICHVSLEYWSTYERYFKSSARGIYNFTKLLDYKIAKEYDFCQTLSANLYQDLSYQDHEAIEYGKVSTIPVQNYADLEELYNIAVKMFETYSSKMAQVDDDGNCLKSLYNYITEDFAHTKTLFDIKEYYYDLARIVDPIFEDIKDKDDTEFNRGETNHFWKVDYANLSNYVDDSIVVKHVVESDADGLFFTALEENSYVQLTTFGSPDHIALQYSYDGNKWEDYPIGKILPLARFNDSVHFRSSSTGNETFSKNSTNYYKFQMGGKIAGHGNVQALVSRNCYVNAVPANFFYGLFSSCGDVLVQSPSMPYTTVDLLSYSYGDIRNIDDTLTSYVEIKSLDTVDIQRKVEDDGKVRVVSAYNTGLISIQDFDKLKVNSTKVPKNTLRIYDISRCNYLKNSDNDIELIGILPVVTTAGNALYYQQLTKTDSSAKAYNPLAKIQTVYNKKAGTWKDTSDDAYYDESNRNYLFENAFCCNKLQSSSSDQAVKNFPTLNFTATQHLDRNYLKQIGIVVFKMTKSPTTNRILLTPVESFVGSLDYNGKDFNTKAQNFIDNVVNDNSQYINVFSNFEFVDKDSGKQTRPIDDATMFMIKDQTATSLGFYERCCYKRIGLQKSILEPLDRIFESLKNIDTVNIDIVIDAGISTIAQFIKSTKQTTFDLREGMQYEKGYYDINDDTASNFKVVSEMSTNIWRNILQKYDNFCKNMRRDCMFIADALRPTCLTANQRNVRTVANTDLLNAVVNKLKYQINLNTSYGAGYCNWFYLYDNFSKTYFWCPPSIKAAGRYIYTDIYYNYWDAPAGLSRGVLENVYGIAFNPTNEEAGSIYNKSWNYAIQYPLQGFVIEGQRTFQIEKTAFDRVNVRRLFLKMEKLVYRIAKRFCYEGNTPYMRQRFVDTIRPIFEEAIQGSGISEYVIICDERNNKTINIENHELHCTIAVRPVKTIEFIVLNFIAMPQSGSFTEETILSMTPYYD